MSKNKTIHIPKFKTGDAVIWKRDKKLYHISRYCGYINNDNNYTLYEGNNTLNVLRTFAHEKELILADKY